MTRWIVVAILISLLLAAACSGGSGPEGLESVIGDCQTGKTLRAGEGCTIAYTDANDTFWVKQDGSGCYSTKKDSAFSTSTTTTTECTYNSLSNDAIAADENDDGSWTVVSVP